MSADGNQNQERKPSIWIKTLSWSQQPRTIFLVGIICLFVFLYWVAHFPLWIHNSPNYQIYAETGEIGDTLGGIIGPPVAILGVILTFLAFYIQYQANAEQRKQFKESIIKQQDHFEKTLSDQEKTHKREQIESRFFELLKIHKDNINEIRLSKNIVGRGSFIYLFYELDSLYRRLHSRANNMQRRNTAEYIISDMEILTLAYTIYFYGTGTTSSKQYLAGLGGAIGELYDACISMLGGIQEDYTDGIIAEEFSYKPYEGHVNKISHMYRHLYFTCNYIVKQEYLQPDEKKEYLKILRAQMSNYEQIMLYYNAIVWFKKEWNDLFVNYQFIHNLPIDIIDMGPDVEMLYEKEIKQVWETQHLYMFEHQKYQPDKAE